MKKILTTVTIASLALCYSDVDAGLAISKAIIKRQVERGADINFAEKRELDDVKYRVKHSADDSEKALRIAKNKRYKKVAGYLNDNLPRDENPGNEQVLNLLLTGKNAVPMDNRRVEQTMNDPYKNGKPVGYELLQHVREGNKEKINEFIKKWPTIGTNNTYATEVFTFVLDTKDVELIKYLLKNKINPNISDYKKRIALAFFAEEGDLGMVEYLVDKGANDIEIALKIAEEKRYNEISNYLQPLVESLLEQKNAIEALYNDLAIDTQTKEVTDEGMLAFANALMMKFPKVNTGIERVIETLWFAIEKGRLDILKYLIRNKINLEVRDYEDDTSLLRISRKINSWETFKYLIDHGANINAKDRSGNTGLIIEAGNGNEERVKYLIDHGADVNAQNRRRLTALYYAAPSGHENIVKYLVEYGADPNKENDFGETPLHLAASSGHENIVKYLVEHRANVNVENIDGETALYFAAAKGHENIVEYLVEHGADLNKEDDTGWTALHLAAQKGHENIVKYLAEHGADLNKENEIGQTALHLAAGDGWENVVKYLVEHGADINAEDFKGKTAFDYAFKYKKTKIRKYLVQKREQIFDHGSEN